MPALAERRPDRLSTVAFQPDAANISAYHGTLGGIGWRRRRYAGRPSGRAAATFGHWQLTADD